MAEVEEEAPKKGGGLIKLLVMIFGGLLLIVIGLGAGYFVFGSSSNDPNQVVDKLIEKEEQEKAAAAEAAGAAEGENAEGEGGPKKISKESKKEEVFQTLYFQFPAPITSNLRGSRRFIQVGLGISTQYDESVIQNVETHLPAITSDLLAALSDYTEDQVQGREARATLANDLKKVINARLEELEGFGGVEGVHFTSYIMQ